MYIIRNKLPGLRKFGHGKLLYMCERVLYVSLPLEIIQNSYNGWKKYLLYVKFFGSSNFSQLICGKLRLQIHNTKMNGV